MLLCIRCAERGTACCLSRDIFVTTSDIRRITECSGAADFYEFRSPMSADYLDQEDDPRWNLFTVQQDGSRRVLKHGIGGKCYFLTDSGCRLPLSARPLVCRLHPVEYTERAITGLSTECPAELLPPDEGLLTNLAMNLGEADRWRQQLYTELETDWSCGMRHA